MVIFKYGSSCGGEIIGIRLKKDRGEKGLRKIRQPVRAFPIGFPRRGCEKDKGLEVLLRYIVRRIRDMKIR